VKKLTSLLLATTMCATMAMAEENCIKDENEKVVGALFGLGMGALIGGPAGVAVFGGIAAILETSPICGEGMGSTKNDRTIPFNGPIMNAKKPEYLEKEQTNPTIPLTTMLFLEKVYHFGLNDFKTTKEPLTSEIINKNGKYLIMSHASQPGTHKYNLELSKRRSNTIVNYLTTNGVKLSDIEVQNYGENRLLCTEMTKSCFDMNQRSELKIIIQETK
jgi:hypothetical protein